MRYIELRINEVQQLFNSMDPSPFHEKDLDGEAEEFIMSWANEIHIGEPVTLRVHLGRAPASDAQQLITEAVHHYFGQRTAHAEREFRHLMRTGRLSLVIGLAFLAVCTTGAELATRQANVWARYLGEGLTIAGWVAMWRPMQTYLYDWWPVRRRIRNLMRLSTMPVDVLLSPAPQGPPA